MRTSRLPPKVPYWNSPSFDSRRSEAGSGMTGHTMHRTGRRHDVPCDECCGGVMIGNGAMSRMPELLMNTSCLATCRDETGSMMTDEKDVSRHRTGSLPTSEGKSQQVWPCRHPARRDRVGRFGHAQGRCLSQDGPTKNARHATGHLDFMRSVCLRIGGYWEMPALLPMPL